MSIILYVYAKLEVFVDKTVRGRAQAERGNTHSGARKKREISRNLLSINLHLLVQSLQWAQSRGSLKVTCHNFTRGRRANETKASRSRARCYAPSHTHRPACAPPPARYVYYGHGTEKACITVAPAPACKVSVLSK